MMSFCDDRFAVSLSHRMELACQLRVHPPSLNDHHRVEHQGNLRHQREVEISEPAPGAFSITWSYLWRTGSALYNLQLEASPSDIPVGAPWAK